MTIGRKLVPHEVRELHARHLKRAVADDRHDPRTRPGHVHAQRRRHGKAHRRVVGRAEELGPAAGRELGRREQRVADVGDHDRARRRAARRAGRSAA